MSEIIHRISNPGFRPPQKPKGSPVKAIAIALLADIIGSISLGIILGMIYIVYLMSDGMSLGQIEHTLRHLHPDSTFSFILLVSSCLATAFTGYLCARIVNYAELRVTAVFALVCAALVFLIGHVFYSSAHNFLLSGLVFVLALFGAWVHVNVKSLHA